MHMMHMGPKSTLNRAYFDTKIPCWENTCIEPENRGRIKSHRDERACNFPCSMLKRQNSYEFIHNLKIVTICKSSQECTGQICSCIGVCINMAT